MFSDKKGVALFIEVVMLILIAVIAIFVLQGWYSELVSKKITSVENQVDWEIVKPVFDDFVGNVLYLENSEGGLVEIINLKVGGNNCSGLNGSYTDTIIELDLSNCLEILSKEVNDIEVYTTRGILSKSFFFSEYGPDYSTYFISIWNTSESGSSNASQITLPLENGGTYNFTVYWGDGTNDNITVWNQAEVIHDYPTPGNYNVNITGTLSGWRFNNGGDKDKLYLISQWGSFNLGDNGSYFEGCTNLDITATDALNLTGTTQLSFMFRYADNLTNPDFTAWDTSNISDLDYMFDQASNFNGDISTWDVSNVGAAWFTFSEATNFNGDISSWNVSNLSSAGAMFQYADAFNQDLSGWDVGNLLNANYMFNDADNFNGNISTWDVSNVTNMAYMFNWAVGFNQDLSGWNTDNVTNCTSFSSNTASWTASKPTFSSCTP